MEEKYLEYAEKILQAVNKIFDEEEECFIDVIELHKDDNLTHFVHAISNAVPNYIVNELTNRKQDQLEFNHDCNKLIFRFSNIKQD